jgi:cysteinyl-tRNA synthetase
MTVRFFILQAHYRSTIDFSNEALKAAEKGYQRLMKATGTLTKLQVSEKSTVDIAALEKKCYEAIDDDLNSPVLLSYLFEGVKYINSVSDGTEKLTAADLELLKKLFNMFVFEILGLTDETAGKGNGKLTNDLIGMIINLRQDAKANKDWKTSDTIRAELKKAGIVLNDTKDGVSWEMESS